MIVSTDSGCGRLASGLILWVRPSRPRNCGRDARTHIRTGAGCPHPHIRTAGVPPAPATYHLDIVYDTCPATDAPDARSLCAPRVCGRPRSLGVQRPARVQVVE